MSYYITIRYQMDTEIDVSSSAIKAEYALMLALMRQVNLDLFDLKQIRVCIHIVRITSSLSYVIFVFYDYVR